jgi:hypothetical protein
MRRVFESAPRQVGHQVVRSGSASGRPQRREVQASATARSGRVRSKIATVTRSVQSPPIARVSGWRAPVSVNVTALDRSSSLRPSWRRTESRSAPREKHWLSLGSCSTGYAKPNCLFGLRVRPTLLPFNPPRSPSPRSLRNSASSSDRPAKHNPVPGNGLVRACAPTRVLGSSASLRRPLDAVKKLWARGPRGRRKSVQVRLGSDQEPCRCVAVGSHESRGPGQRARCS